MDQSIKNWLKKMKLNESTISMLLGALVVIVVGVLIFNYFSMGGEEGITPEEISPEEITLEEIQREKKKLPAKHKVKAGDHLWAIALDYYQDGYQWPEIAKANKLGNPSLISPGQKLTIPKVAARVTPKEAKPEMEPIAGEKYTVKKGDCLWNIALRAYGDPYKWPEISKANKLVNPDLIYADSEFVIPR